MRLGEEVATPGDPRREVPVAATDGLEAFRWWAAALRIVAGQPPGDILRAGAVQVPGPARGPGAQYIPIGALRITLENSRSVITSHCMEIKHA